MATATSRRHFKSKNGKANEIVKAKSARVSSEKNKSKQKKGEMVRAVARRAAKAKSKKQAIINRKKELKPLPCTVLSGFLGSGKTTLLKHILQSDEHGLRIAVIVNDIGAINVDGQHIKRTEEKVVELQNGCICCTLRGDLIEELIRLYDLGLYDYVIIESSGISEPQQVAESFDPKLAEIMMMLGSGELDAAMTKALKRIKQAGSLAKFAFLDTAVSVVDAYTMLSDFETDQILADRRDDADPEGEGGQTVAHLLVDQIEFANVVILNKVGMVDAETRERLRLLIKKLNHGCKIVETNFGQLDPKLIVQTGLFNLEQASMGAGWLADVHEMAVREVNGRKHVTPKPETEEYGIRNFVYIRTRPFHPRRLWQMIYDRFILRMPEAPEDDDDDDEDEDDGDVDMDSATGGSDSGEKNQDEDEGEDDNENENDLVPPPDTQILKNRQQDPLLRRLLRSKGGFFLATRPQRMGDWSQAGAQLELQPGTEWYCTQPAEELATGIAAADEMIRADIERGGEWGDRRQEIVFIGEQLDVAALEERLDGALLDDKEWEEWQRIMRDGDLTAKEKAEKLQDVFEDGFPNWPDEDEDDHPGHGHEHDDDVEGGICVKP